MVELSRRQFVCTAIAASVLPRGIPGLPATAAVAAPAPLLPAWVVGTPGEFDWQMIRAVTEEAALIERAREEYGDGECFDREACTGCEYCEPLGCGYEASRASAMDTIVSPSPADWLRAGFNHTCSRCEDEYASDNIAVGDEAVCEDCMEIADWEIVDPERAAEMRADLEEA